MNFLKILPLSRVRLDVLLEIYAEREDYLRNIAKKLKLNPSLAFNVLNRLYDAKFTMKKRVGKEVQYSLNKNRDYEILTKLLEEYHLEKILDRSKILKTAIGLLLNNKELINSSYKIYLFGSYVLGDYTKRSDIDILFANENRKLVGKTCREISAIMGNKLDPLIYTKKKFKSDLLKQEPLLNSIVNNVKNRAIIQEK